MPVPTHRTMIHEAYIECGGQRIGGLQMFDASSSTGLSSAQRASGSINEIDYAEFPLGTSCIKGQPLAPCIGIMAVAPAPAPARAPANT